jgi:hypothetical protein
MNAAEWTTFLATWTDAIGARETENRNTRREIDPIHGLGFPGATDAQIAATEARLGVSLPSSYSEFLKVTNGFDNRLTPSRRVAETSGPWPISIGSRRGTPSGSRRMAFSMKR